MCNTLQISPTVLSNAAFVVSGGITFLFKHWGHTKVLHPSNIKTFRLPVAHKTVELFEPSACLSSLSLFPSLSLSLFSYWSFPSAKVFWEAPWVRYFLTVLVPVSQGSQLKGLEDNKQIQFDQIRQNYREEKLKKWRMNLSVTVRLIQIWINYWIPVTQP